MADFEAIFELDEREKIDCVFEINATVYNYEELDKKPQINGETLIGDKSSSDLHLASEQGLLDEIENRQNADIEFANNLSELDSKVDGINANLTQQIEETQQDISTKYNELINDIDAEIQAREQADTTINQRITDVADELQQSIEENVMALQQEDTALQNQINAHSQTLTAYDTRITNNANTISQEIADRQTGDNTLQEQVNDNANLIETKQDIISDLSTIRSNAQAGYNIIPQVESNTQRIEDLTTARFPNVVIVGTPHIEGGQVSNYSDTNYLQFPFIDISRGQPFDIYFSFTTASDVNTQQNILDSYFGIALAIQNGKGIMALSSNGTGWDIGTATGTNNLLPNTTYFVKYSWTGTQYQASLSTDDQTYIPDMNLTSSLSPHKTTIFIGGSPNLFGPASAHPFKGTINFNKSKVVVNGITVWEGMGDVGLASRANVSLTNLDEVGENRFNEKQNVTDNNLVTLDKTVVGAVNELDAKIKDIQLFKFPDATIIGTPIINNGQVSGFSSNNYLILPFAFDAKDRAFEINMAFTTGSNISATQNLLGGNYCVALLLEGGVLKFRASNNGTSWNVADITTSLTVQANTNYFVRIEFNKLNYKVLYSTNGEDYTQIGYQVSTLFPRHGQVFIGVGNNQFNPFLGIINLNRCNIKLNTSIIWQGMDDAGLATRADISLSNLDELGQAKFDAKQDKLTAGNGIDITNNKISTNTQFNIIEDMFDIEYDDTKGVAPYSTSYGYTNVTIKSDSGVEWVDGAIYTFVLDTKVATSTYRNVRLRIGESGDWKPLMGVSSTIASGAVFFIKVRAIPFQYKSTYIEDGALHTMYYDTDTTYTLNYMYDAGKYPAGVGKYALSRYSLVMQKPDGTWEKITDTSKTYSTATTKPVNTRGFLLNQIKYYRDTTVYANGALIASNVLCSQYNSFSASYSFNCGSDPGWAVGDYIYLVGTIGSDGLFYLDTTKWWDNALPTTNDGKIYIQLGSALTTTDSTMTFLNNRPMFYHDGTSVKQYIVHDDTKQNIITDLDTIRIGASKGATALQNITSSNVTNALGYTPYNATNPNGYTSVNESTVSGWGFTKNTGTYSKPSTGIPKTDLASAVQTSLGKADTALQSVPSNYVTDTQLATKQDKLTAGSAIGIDNNEVAVKLFDKSKFTVVGNPTITDDGIASGFSDGNYLSLSNFLKQKNKYKINLSFVFNGYRNANNLYAYIFAENDGLTGLSIYIDGGAYTLNIRAGQSNANTPILNLSIGDIVDMKISYDNGIGNVVYSINKNTEQTKSLNLTNYVPFASDTLTLGGRTSDASSFNLNGSIDLKQFSITVDGVEVFNGNKTIYQALNEKSPLIYNAQAFEFIGEPLITDDGIASRFDQYNYIEVPNINLSQANSWEITYKNVTRYTGNGFILSSNKTNGLAIRRGLVWLSSNGTSWDIAGGVGTDIAIPENSICKLSFNGSKYVLEYKNNDTWVQLASIDSNLKLTSQLTKIIIGTLASNPVTCSIDLKQFSITVDGVEVFNGGVLKSTANLSFIPSDRYRTLTLGASGATYIAPANGWFYLNKRSGGSGKYISLQGKLTSTIYSAAASEDLATYVPCKKREHITVSYTASSDTNAFRFIYTEGAN